MTREEAEKAFEQAYEHLRLSVKAGQLGIYTPDSLKALLRAGQAMLGIFNDQGFKGPFIRGLMERDQPSSVDSAQVIDLFGARPRGDG